jgi:hypothetical protein
MSAGSWTIVGLVLSLIGVLLLFRYGMPYRVRTGGAQFLQLQEHDAEAETLERRYNKLGLLGLALTILGTICQGVGAY